MGKKTVFEPIQAKTMLTAVKSPAMPFDWSLNPYRGCQHGCSFCYARSTHSFLGMEADDTFQHHIVYKENAAEALRLQLDKWRRSRSGVQREVAIGTATDPYQPIEAKMKLTRQCLELLAEYQVPVSITTRSPLILRDLDVLKQMNITSINISINTLDPSVWRNLEPFTPSPALRLETVSRLVEEGFHAGIFMAPILPFLTDDEDSMESLIRSASEANVKFVMSSILRLNTSEVKSWFFQTLRTHYPQYVPGYAQLYQGSVYAKDSYRTETKARIQRLFSKYRIPVNEPFERKAAPVQHQEEQPVQLSFSF
jgi:DNA repair photolyase